jgi:5-methylcytosine-specific restriction endonuclease McrA
MRNPPKRKSGMTYACVDCGEDYIFNTGATSRCRPCQKKAQRGHIRSWESRNPELAKKHKQDSRLRCLMSGNREKALNRDNNTCQICFTQDSVFVHHIDGQGASSDKANDGLDNLVTLCNSCHHQLHADISKELWKRYKDDVLEIYGSIIDTKKEAI